MTSLPRPTPRQAGKASIALLALLSAFAFYPAPSRTMPGTAPVTRGPFVDAIIEDGVVSSQHLRLYSSALNGLPTSLTFLIPEGTAVAPGDVLARFDVSAYEQTLARTRADLAQAVADVERERADARLETLRAEADREAARHVSENARRALANQTDGKGAVDRAAADTAVNDATREWQQARATADDMQSLLKAGFVTRLESDRAAQALQHAADEQRLAVVRRDALINYEAPANLSRAQADVTVAAANAQRLDDTIAARLRAHAAVLASAESRVHQLSANVDALALQVARGTIIADVHGLAVHREIYFGAERRKPQIGDEVGPGQPIVAVPDLTHLSVDTRVRERDLGRVAPGSRVRVRFDAFPDLVLNATVTAIGAVAEADPTRANAKFFPVTVALESGDARLRSGMSAHVELIVTELTSALVVPSVAVAGGGTTRTVDVFTGGRIERRVVVVAADNGTIAVIRSGLSEGDRVVLPGQPGVEHRP